MAKIQVVRKTFTDENGKPVEYERLAITGFVSGEIHTLEIKLSSSEIMLAKMLLASDEEAPTVTSRKATDDEAPTVTKTNEDDEDWLSKL